MIIHLLEQLNKLQIVLASASPRRHQILSQLGVSFGVRVSAFAENLPKGERTPAQYVMDTCKHKAIDVYTAALAARATNTAASANTATATTAAAKTAGGAASAAADDIDIVISADTVVVLEPSPLLAAVAALVPSVLLLMVNDLQCLGRLPPLDLVASPDEE